MTAELTSLAELEAKATPGPWVVERDSHEGSYDHPTSEDCDWPWRIAGVCNFAEEGGTEADAALVVAMRNALPALLNLVEAAREFFNVEWGETRSDSAVPFMEAERKLREAFEALGGER